jgi:hypothetical protein
MTWFNFFNKPVVLHCYTNRADVFNFSPIQKANKFIPAWWKNLPKTYFLKDSLQPFSTMKYCVGVTDLYKKGFVIPMWSEMAVEVGEINSGSYRYQYADETSTATAHNPQQFGAAYPSEKYQHLKLDSPWVFMCDEDIDFLFTEPTWNIDTPEIIKILPGILNYKYQSSTNINTIWLRQDKPVVYTIDHNQPIIHVIPLTQKIVELKLHLVNDIEYENLTKKNKLGVFTKKYSVAKKLTKARGCPFHFKPEK